MMQVHKIMTQWNEGLVSDSECLVMLGVQESELFVQEDQIRYARSTVIMAMRDKEFAEADRRWKKEMWGE